MPLSSGSRLGPYEVLSPLGAGGMGEVYRARDARLGREVAIKVLPAALASDAERLKRFEREARSASSLNHPNIVTIYDIGSEGGVSFIAMELVKGESLRAELAEGALPVRKLLQIGTQIAEGLAKAHTAGIVHRDLKPDNVMVTEDGHVKILDFGLAKLTQPEGSSGGTTIAPTVSGATEAGVILGTVGYMSPEQATGSAVDFRSDQFSFGSILYEMATGRRAFQRASAPQTLAAIIQEEPEPIASINPKVPAPLRWIVERCLAKEAKRRFASTEDLAFDLATVRDHLAEASSEMRAVAEAPARRYRPWVPAAVAAVMLAAIGVQTWRLRQVETVWRNPLAGARYTRLTDWEGSEFNASISSDGKFVVFISDRDGPLDVWVVQVGSGAFVNLTRGKPTLNPRSARQVGFSGDAAHVWINYDPGKAESSISLAPTMGGAVRPFLTDAVEPSWSPDRRQILFHGSGPGDPIFLVDASGGNRRQIHTDKPGIHNHFPTWSPDGRFVYFVRGAANRDTDLYRARLEGGTVERLTQRSTMGYPVFVDDRTVIYTAVREDSGFGLFALDLGDRKSRPVTSGLEEYLSLAASGDGRHLVATVANPDRTLWTVPIADHTVDETGIRRFSLPTVRASNPRFGTDRLLYLSSRSGPDGLWQFRDGIETELWKGTNGAVAFAPTMSPDGAQIAFVVNSEGKSRLHVTAADGTNAHRIAESLEIGDAPSWSPDGKWIAVVASEASARPLFKVPVAGGAPIRLVDGVNRAPLWSPDGRFIVYGENQDGPRDLLRGVTPDGRPFPLPDVRVPWGGIGYRFLPSGKALVLAQGKRRAENFWLLDLATGSMRQLTDLRPGFRTDSFDVSPDGKQILFDRYRENSDIVLIDLPPRS